MMGWGNSPMGSFGVFAFWGILILIVVMLMRGIFGGRSSNLQKEVPALEILKQRYAKGEIDREEFEERKKVLSA